MSEEVKKIKKKYEELLLGVKGVTGVGLNGSIIVYVEKVTPELRQVIPRQLESIPVRIEESGKVVLMALRPMLAVYANRTDRWRPAPGGVSVGHPLATAGTLTSRILDRISGEVIGGLTNNHVGALDWGEKHEGKVSDPFLQPGPYDGGVDDKFGEVLKWIPVKLEEPNLVDAMVFSSAELRKDVLEVGNPTHSVEPMVGRNVLGSGRTSGVKYGQIFDVNATIKVDGGEGWGECLFEQQIILKPSMLVPGDSGMWIGEVDTFNSVGLGFAGSEILSVANWVLNVEELLSVEVIPPAPSLSLGTMLGLWTTMFGVAYQFIQTRKEVER